MIYHAHTGHSHLFPGAAVQVDGPAAGEPLEPFGLVIRFSDGEEAAAEVLVPSEGEAGGGLLAVEAHTTRAGTLLPSRTWTIREHTAREGGLTLRLGAALPGEGQDEGTKTQDLDSPSS
ncbi:hypothetical protein [Nonomuraea dietziae]|uniref:hypothetical protein n=1 Tax=Nonomuraea dietziae TaxID=65515 RepID=UPI0033C6AE1F